MNSAPRQPSWAAFPIHNERERAARWALWHAPEVSVARAWGLVTSTRGQTLRLFEEPGLREAVCEDSSSPDAMRTLLQPSSLEAWGEAEEALRLERGHVVDAWSPRYPERLKRMKRPPMFLSIQGTLPDGPSVAIVGSRRGAGYLESFTQDFAAALARVGVRVWSGGALGLDAAAHRGGLEARSVAMLASGVLRPTPRTHASLFRRMVDAGGALVSERGLVADVRRSSYHRRNAVLATWVDAVLVVHAQERSGTWITAQAALKAETPLLVVPHGPFEEVEGSRALLRAGATPVWEPEDVLRALSVTPGPVEVPQNMELWDVEPPEGQGAVVWEWLQGRGWVGVDDVCVGVGVPAHQASIALLELELGGWVERESGAPRYRRREVVR